MQQVDRYAVCHGEGESGTWDGRDVSVQCVKNPESIRLSSVNADLFPVGLPADYDPEKLATEGILNSGPPLLHDAVRIRTPEIQVETMCGCCYTSHDSISLAPFCQFVAGQHAII